MNSPLDEPAARIDGRGCQSQRHQHAEREIHAHHRAARHPRVVDERHEPRERLRQRQAQIEPGNRQKRPERPDCEHHQHRPSSGALLRCRATCPCRIEQHDDRARSRSSRPPRCDRARGCHTCGSRRRRITDETDFPATGASTSTPRGALRQKYSGSRNGRTRPA